MLSQISYTHLLSNIWGYIIVGKYFRIITYFHPHQMREVLNQLISHIHMSTINIRKVSVKQANHTESPKMPIKHNIPETHTTNNKYPERNHHTFREHHYSSSETTQIHGGIYSCVILARSSDFSTATLNNHKNTPIFNQIIP